MYPWLETAIESGGPIVTANLRLARELRQAYGRLMLARGKTAWRTPPVFELHAWLQQACELGDHAQAVVLANEQAQILWERVLRLELGDANANLSRLAKDARKSRERLAEYRVPVAEVGDYAYSDDQKLFASALNRYLQLLSREAWTDRAGVLSDALVAIESGRLNLPQEIALVGFVNGTPNLAALRLALEARGCKLRTVLPGRKPATVTARFVDDAAELRAAGRWARSAIDADADARIGIVVQDLEERVFEATQHIREGFCPGWQLEPGRTERLVNVSYGRRMLEYPAIQSAMLSLRWITGALAAPDISILLRSTCLGRRADDGSRIIAELALRDTPVREWTVDEFVDAFLQSDGALTELLEDLQAGAACVGSAVSTPASFARQFNAALERIGWPGSGSLGSNEFQLINRWREALNQLSALGSVEPNLSAAAALARLNAMLADAVFQPESTDKGIDVVGPLEAAGIEFDALWVTGMSAESWPGRRRPDPLISRELQLKYAMPDASPELVRIASERLFSTLATASERLVLSFGQFDGDAERSPSPMLPQSAEPVEFCVPERFGVSLRQPDAIIQEPHDPVPGVAPGERVFGGASIIDRQSTSPFDAFALSRLGIQPIWPFSHAFSAKDRGILVHDALARFYAPALQQSDLQAWTDEDASERAANACRTAFQRAFRGKSRVQATVLRFEEARMARLLLAVWEFDCQRQSAFQIATLEERQTLILETLKMHIQADRIDQLSDGSVLVLDYKTGSEKRLLSKDELTSFQLVLYAMASKARVSGIALYNVNASGIKLHGAGGDFSKKTDVFAESFDRWTAIALAHARNVVAGDVRVLAQQVVRDSRRTGLLSRVAELKRDA